MQSTTNKSGKPTKGFTMVPNALIDSHALDDTDKLVYIVLKRHAIGKDEVWPSQVRIAARARKSRKSVRCSLRKLTGAGIVQEVKRDGRGQVTYRLNLDVDLERIAQVPGTKCPGKSADLERNAHQAYSIENTKKADADSEITVGVLGDVKPGGSNGNESCSAYEGGPGTKCPGLSKKQINDLLLTPDGKIPDDEPDALLCNLDGALLMAGGKAFNRGVLDALVDEHGPRYCAFWTEWLLRKCAAEYEAGRIVKNPGGLYTEAVRGHWEVDPAWPEFNEKRHPTQEAWLIRNGLSAGNASDDSESAMPF